MCSPRPKAGAWIVLGVLVVAMAMLLPSAGQSAQERVLLLKVIEQRGAWSDADLYEQLHQMLSRNQRLRVLPAEPIYEDQPAFPVDVYHTDSLMNWGLEIGGRYLMVVVVDGTRLERRKSFSLPLIMHTYQTYGVISGELRLLDLIRGRMLAAEPFEVTKKGPRAWQQAFEDDRGDPALHVSAPQKVRFFTELQKKTALMLMERLQELTGV